MTITSAYVNIEGEETIKDTLARMAFCFITRPVQAARIQAENEADALFSSASGTGETELEMMLSQEKHPGYDAYVEERVETAKHEASNRGVISYISDTNGLTSDSASYTRGTIHIDILDEAGFAAYCSERN